jgi:hypothetical protein
LSAAFAPDRAWPAGQALPASRSTPTQESTPMAKEDLIEMHGVVNEVLPDSR